MHEGAGILAILLAIMKCKSQFISLEFPCRIVDSLETVCAELLISRYHSQIKVQVGGSEISLCISCAGIALQQVYLDRPRVPLH